MNSNVHPLVVVLVLALTALAVGTWMWGSGAAANIGGPSELQADANGHAYIQIQDVLIEHDADGQYVKTHDLQDLGVEVFLGTYAFFSNGDILLRRGPDPRSFGDNLRAFQRKTNQHSIFPDTPESGLVRCQLSTETCSPFGQVDFKAAYGIYIEPETDEVYISDTTRHVLRKYSKEGAEIAGPVDGFKFPNRILIHNERLYVADTNHHEVRVVSPETQTFGLELGRHNVTPPLATEARQIWPSDLARVGNGWWTNNMRQGMNQGGVYIFDDAWRLTRKLGLPDDADPISMLVLGDEVWVSDWYNDKVWRFSTAGDRLPDLESAGLENILLQSRIDRRAYELIGYSGVGLLILVLAGLLVRGFSVGMTTDAPMSEGDQVAREANSDLHLQPDEKALRRLRTLQRMVLLLAVSLVAVFVYIISSRTEAELDIESILLSLGFPIIAALIYWTGHANTGTSVSVSDGFVTLTDHTGRESTCPVKDVRYDDTSIATHDAVVFLGQPLSSFYNRKDLKDRLFPRIADAQKVSPLVMHKILITMRHPQGLITVFCAVIPVVYMAYTLAQ